MINRFTIFLWVIVIALISAIVFYYLTEVNVNHSNYLIENSTFDFSETDFEEEAIITLYGKVNFYNDTFLQGQCFTKSIEPTSIIKIGEPWNNYKADSDKHKGVGYGTFRFTIIVPDAGSYGINVKGIKSAYQLFVNDSLLGGSGVAGKTKEEMVPSRYINEFYFTTVKDSNEVIIQVSNFHHREGGLTGYLKFGKKKDIILYKNRRIGSDLFLMGILFILFIYHLALFAYRPNERSILYFSILCLLILFRLGYTNEKTLLELLSFIKWPIATRIEYIALMGLPIVITLFIKELFPNEINNLFVKALAIVNTGFIAIVIVTPPILFSYTLLYFLLIMSASACYMLFIVYRAVINRRIYSGPIFLGFLIFFLFSINDGLHYRHVIQSVLLMPIGWFMVTISQAYVLARKMAADQLNIEKLSEELTLHANHLEDIVEKRTQKIRKQKTEIEKQKADIEQKAIELKENNIKLIELAHFKNDMTHLLVHDLKSPLSNIIGFSELTDNPEKSLKFIHNSGWTMHNLIQNILDVEKYETTGITPTLLKTDLYDIVDSAYNSSLHMFNLSHIKFQSFIEKQTYIKADKNLLERVLANIFSNAAKYSNSDNTVLEVKSKVTEFENKPFLKIDVYNSGQPIPADKLDEIFNRYSQLQKADESMIFSTGIGLHFCKLAITAHNGKIGAISGEKEGVTFWFTIPLDN